MNYKQVTRRDLFGPNGVGCRTGCSVCGKKVELKCVNMCLRCQREAQIARRNK